MHSPSPRWDEKMSRFICVFIWTSTSDVHFDMKSPNESFSNWNWSIFGRSFSAMLVEHKQVLYLLCFRLILESRRVTLWNLHVTYIVSILDLEGLYCHLAPHKWSLDKRLVTSVCKKQGFFQVQRIFTVRIILDRQYLDQLQRLNL